ncbi:MAG: ferrous iron transport protein A [Clostridia bacterium]|nr:ferrous iron transport protein A [Clostridia bacterium]
MPIVMAPMNTPVTVIKILAEEKVKKHLENLGITIGSSVIVLSEEGGSVILLVKEGRLALDKNLATKILVRI